MSIKLVAPAACLGCGVAILLFATHSLAARHDPPEREMVHDAPLVTLLDWGDIPSIDAPVFVPVAVADEFMDPEEPVIGVTDPDGGHPRCYSLVHLDHHEVVNDVVVDTPIAVTW